MTFFLLESCVHMLIRKKITLFSGIGFKATLDYRVNLESALKIVKKIKFIFSISVFHSITSACFFHSLFLQETYQSQTNSIHISLRNSFSVFQLRTGGFSSHKNTYFKNFIYILSLIVGLLYNIGIFFCHTSIWIGSKYTCVPFFLSPCHLPLPPTPLGCHRALVLGSLCHTANSHWLSVLHMILCIFQWYFLKSSHPVLPPLCPKDCSLCLCFLCCPECRIISTIFLDMIYLIE